MHDRPGNPCVVVPDQLSDKDATRTQMFSSLVDETPWYPGIALPLVGKIAFSLINRDSLFVYTYTNKWMTALMLLPGLSQLQWQLPTSYTATCHCNKAKSFWIELWQELPFNVTISLLHRFQRAITTEGEKTTDTAIMQTSSPSLNHVDSIELSDPSKNPHESKIEAREDSTSEDDVYVERFLDGFKCVADDHSPNPDVQASVSDTDEDVPVNTFRAWFLGIIGTMVLTALNQFFQLHNPPRKSGIREDSTMYVCANIAWNKSCSLRTLQSSRRSPVGDWWPLHCQQRSGMYSAGNLPWTRGRSIKRSIRS